MQRALRPRQPRAAGAKATKTSRRSEAIALLAGERRLLEMIATGVPLTEILNALCLIIEEQRSGTLASVLLLAADGIHLESAGGPSIPEDWKREMGRLAHRTLRRLVRHGRLPEVAGHRFEHRGRSALGSAGASLAPPCATACAPLGRARLFPPTERFWAPSACTTVRRGAQPQTIWSLSGWPLTSRASQLNAIVGEEALRRSEAFLAEGQRISHTGSWSWDVSTGRVTWSEEHCRIYGADPETTKPTYQLFLRTVHPDDRVRIERDLDEIVRQKRAFDMEFRIALPDGTVKNVLGIGRPVLTPAGDACHYIGTTVDITPRKRAEILLAGEKQALEMVARGESLPKILECLCTLVEELSPGALSSILLLDANGKTLRHGAAPKLPREYVEAIDGASIGPAAGSCGTAAYSAKLVIVSDIVSDPLWGNYRALALPHGLRACWSNPILSSDGKVRGTFAIYYREPRSPTPQQLEIIERITHIASIALERLHAEAALRASEALARGQVEALVQHLDVLATSPAPDQFIVRMLSTMARLLKSEWVCLWLVDEKTQALVLRASVGAASTKDERDHPFVKDPYSWKDDPGVQEMFFTGVPAAYEEIATDPRIVEPLRSYFRRSGTKKLLRLPTLVGGEVKGFIALRHGERPPYRPEEIELAQALAHQAMLAIHSRQAATLEERNRMARDIHDTLAQGFTAIVVQLQAAEDASTKGLQKDAEKHLRTACDLARQSLQEARRSVQALRPLALERRNFWEAFKDSVKRATAGTPLQIKVQMRGQPRELPVLWQENLLHVGQEALTNTLRYANAAHFRARLNFETKALRFELEDDGDGFTTSGRHDGFGLIGMRERVEQMGGRLTITSAPREGTKVVIVSPYVRE